MTDSPEIESGATPDPVDAGAMPAPEAPPTEASGAMPPSESTGLEVVLKREREARRKAEAELKKLRPQAVDAEALAVRVQELEEAAKRAERDALIGRIVSETGLPSVLRDRLHGDDETSLREDAQAIKAALPTSPPPQTNSSNVGGPMGAPAQAKSPQEWESFLRNRR